MGIDIRSGQTSGWGKDHSQVPRYPDCNLTPIAYYKKALSPRLLSFAEPPDLTS